MKSIKLTVIGLTAAAALTACQPSDPQLTSPPPAPVVYKATPPIDRPVVEISAKGLTVSYDPRVDILFVIDDSRSMKTHQENLSRNMAEFVNGFAKNKAIDFHIGYTTVYDRLRYGPIVPASCGFGQPGTLKPLVGSGAPTDGRRYLTSSDTNFRELLRDNLDPKINTSLLKDIYSKDICMTGPENEESFTPALGALEDPTVVNGPNKGFRRAGAFFVVIIVSDAKDESGIAAKDFVNRLRKDTGETQSSKKQFRVYSVAVGPGTIIGKAPGVCMPDPAFADSSFTDKKGATHYIFPDSRQVRAGENPLVDAASLTEDASSPKDGQFLSICDRDYGAALARFGYQIQQDTLSDMNLDLPYSPQIVAAPVEGDPAYDAKLQEYDAKRLRVFLGKVELTEGKQWSYNPQRTSVIVYGQKIDWNKYPGEKVRVSYTPVDMTLKTTRPINNP